MSWIFEDHKGTDWELETNFDSTGKVRITGPNGTFRIPAEVMISFTAEVIRVEKMAELEIAHPLEFLGASGKSINTCLKRKKE